MSAWVNYLLIGCFALAVLLIAVDYARRRSWRRPLACLVALAAFALLLSLTTSFPYPSSRQAFGGASPLVALVLMFGGVLFGIAATYIFNLSGEFSWRDFARPLVASPIVLLPLIGSVQGAALEPIQLVSFTVLAFQNGFFWQQVLREAKPKT
jgi:hypothetical protein